MLSSATLKRQVGRMHNPRGSTIARLHVVAGTGFAVGLNATNVLPHRSVKWLISPMWGPSQQSLSTIALTHRGDRVVVGGFTRGRSHYLEETGEVIEHTKGDSSTDMVIGSIALSGTWLLDPRCGAPLR